MPPSADFMNPQQAIAYCSISCSTCVHYWEIDHWKVCEQALSFASFQIKQNGPVRRIMFTAAWIIMLVAAIVFAWACFCRSSQGERGTATAVVRSSPIWRPKWLVLVYCGCWEFLSPFY